MILLGENTDGLIASELLKPSLEQITVFCGVPRKEMATLFRKRNRLPLSRISASRPTSDLTAEKTMKSRGKEFLKDTGK